jgi:hypothetical protein
MCGIIIIITRIAIAKQYRTSPPAFGVEKIQNGGCYHGNQGAKNVKFTPNFTGDRYYDCTGSCKSNYHMIKTMITMACGKLKKDPKLRLAWLT